MAIACYHCGKEITGEVKHIVPPKFMESMGVFPTTYHPECYRISEDQAAKELGPEMDLKHQIDKFVAHIDKVSVDYFARMGYTHSEPPKHRADYISDKWCRIVVLEKRGEKWESTSVYCFVCLKDYQTKTLGVLKAGDIHMPASFKVPAKHARGSVFKADFDNCAGPHGVVYLRKSLNNY